MGYPATAYGPWATARKPRSFWYDTEDDYGPGAEFADAERVRKKAIGLLPSQRPGSNTTQNIWTLRNNLVAGAPGNAPVRGQIPWMQPEDQASRLEKHMLWQPGNQNDRLASVQNRAAQNAEMRRSRMAGFTPIQANMMATSQGGDNDLMRMGFAGVSPWLVGTMADMRMQDKRNKSVLDVANVQGNTQRDVATTNKEGTVISSENQKQGQLGAAETSGKYQVEGQKTLGELQLKGTDIATRSADERARTRNQLDQQLAEGLNRTNLEQQKIRGTTEENVANANRAAGQTLVEAQSWKDYQDRREKYALSQGAEAERLRKEFPNDPNRQRQGMAAWAANNARPTMWSPNGSAGGGIVAGTPPTADANGLFSVPTAPGGSVSPWTSPTVKNPLEGSDYQFPPEADRGGSSPWLWGGGTAGAIGGAVGARYGIPPLYRSVRDKMANSAAVAKEKIVSANNRLMEQALADEGYRRTAAGGVERLDDVVARSPRTPPNAAGTFENVQPTNSRALVPIEDTPQARWNPIQAAPAEEAAAKHAAAVAEANATRQAKLAKLSQLGPTSTIAETTADNLGPSWSYDTSGGRTVGGNVLGSKKSQKLAAQKILKVASNTAGATGSEVASWNPIIASPRGPMPNRGGFVATPRYEPGLPTASRVGRLLRGGGTATTAAAVAADVIRGGASMAENATQHANAKSLIPDVTASEMGMSRQDYDKFSARSLGEQGMIRQLAAQNRTSIAQAQRDYEQEQLVSFLDAGLTPGERKRTRQVTAQYGNTPGWFPVATH